MTTSRDPLPNSSSAAGCAIFTKLLAAASVEIIWSMDLEQSSLFCLIIMTDFENWTSAFGQMLRTKLA